MPLPTGPLPVGSAPATLLAAKMITADANRASVVVLTTTVPLERPVAQVHRAQLFASAHGVYEAQVNGDPVADSVLAPGWNSYEWRLAWQEYDVTNLLASGTSEVTLSARLGNGWYRGDFGFWEPLNYGEEIGFLGALEIEFADGHRQVVTSDGDWTGWSSDTPSSSLYNGQRIDARLRQAGQSLPVHVIEFDHGTLVPQTSPAVRRQEVLRPQRIWISPAGHALLDFGQNLVGWLRITVSGPAGTEITIRHAEALENEELATAPLRNAKATDTFILSGLVDTFEPTFTFHGFRYAEVTGWPGELTAASVEAVVVGSELRPTGSFECSDPRVNQLVHNSIWGQKGNFLSVPTDCPQRDERLGWTGDIAVYAATAAYQFDIADFLHDWLLDVAVEQRAAAGVVPWVVPDLLKYQAKTENHLAAVWADAAVWVPEALWRAYGNIERLAEHYPAMVAHLEAVERVLSPTGLWDTGFQFGDWLDPDAPPQDAAAAKADSGVVATACVHRSAAFAAEVARLLGNAQQARWASLAERIKKAFNTHYVEAGIIRSDCATVYALALQFGLLDEDERGRAALRLAQLVREAGHLATTGFAGTPFVTWALSDNGYTADAYRLLLQQECPSWLYQVTMGATTMWERWDSVLPDGTLNDPIMTSLNHYAFGAVCDWLYKVVAGIQPGEPGYCRILLKPTPGPGLDWVEASYESRVGRINVDWRQVDDQFTFNAALPAGVPADIILPDGTELEVIGGTHTWTCALR